MDSQPSCTLHSSDMHFLPFHFEILEVDCYFQWDTRSRVLSAIKFYMYFKFQLSECSVLPRPFRIIAHYLFAIVSLVSVDPR